MGVSFTYFGVLAVPAALAHEKQANLRLRLRDTRNPRRGCPNGHGHIERVRNRALRTLTCYVVRMTYWSRRQHSNIFGHPNNRFWTCLTMMAFVFVASLHFNLLKLFSWKYHTVSLLARTRYTTIYNLKRNLEQQNGTSFFIMPHGNCTWHVCLLESNQEDSNSRAILQYCSTCFRIWVPLRSP